MENKSIDVYPVKKVIEQKNIVPESDANTSPTKVVELPQQNQ